MESLNQNSSLIEEDANISLFRRRNKVIIIVFLFLIISSALIIAALIVELLRIHSTSTRSHSQALISPIRSFCSVSDSPIACLNAFIPITKNRVILDPDQILTISLQTSVSQIQNFINSSDSHSLRHALGQLEGALAVVRVNPFVSSLSHDQREEIGKQIIAAGEDVKACIDQLAAGGVAAPEKLVEVGVYLNGGRDFLFRYAVVLRNWGTVFVTSERSLIYDYLFEIVMCGLQVLFMFGMFFALFRIR